MTIATSEFDPSHLDHSPEWLEFIGGLAILAGRYQAQGQRKGQAIMNALARFRPDLYNFASGAIWDPFYRDDDMTRFWREIYNKFILTLDD